MRIRIHIMLRVVIVVMVTVSVSIGQETSAVGTNAYTELAGPLPKTVKAENGPYLVVADIEVPVGRVVTIEAGAVFLFKNFTGMHIQGRLYANGTALHPIVFTSEFDRDYNASSTLYPNPYDWNGLYVHDNAIGSELANCKVMFSVYGIISDTKFIRVTSSTFTNNGKSNLVIEGDEHFVTNEPYTYALSLKDATVDGVPVKILRDPLAPKRNTFRFGGLGLFAAGVGFGIYETLQWKTSQSDLDNLSSVDNENLMENDGNSWKAAKNDRDISRILTGVGYGVGILGSAGFAVSFRF